MSLCKSYSCSEVEAINALPSIEKPFKLPKIYVAEGFDTVQDENGNIGFGVYVPNENQIYVAGDVEDEIRARVLFHEVCHWVQAMCGRPFDEDEANEFSDIVYDALPSAQPKPCEDAVSREAGVEEIRRHGVGSFDFEDYTPEQAERFAIKLLQDLPSVTPEPCEDAVSRRKAFEYFVSLWECIGTIMDREEWEDVCKTTANELPSVTPKRKTGKWIKRDVSRQIHGISCSAPNYQCSVCKKWWFHNGEGLKWYKFCPECGADMRGEQNEQTN